MDDATVPAAAASPVAGRDYPRDLAQFRAWFGTDDACMDYLDWLRWRAGFRCPHCGGPRSSGGPGHRRCTDCDAHVSVTAGTVLERTRTPLSVWFEAAWLMTTNKAGVSAAYLHRVLPVSSYQTAWTMLAKLRQAMHGSSGGLLAGTVEVDEAFFGGPRPGAPGRGAGGKTLVAGAIEITSHGWGRARLQVIEDASAASLQAFARATIAPGATVVTDGWGPYQKALSGYEHRPVNVSASGRPAHESLPAVHRLFALVKRMIEGTYQGSGTTGHLAEYFDEFLFRFNRRHSHHRGLVFMRLLERVVGRDPVTYRQLVREPRPKKDSPHGLAGPRSHPGTLHTTPVDRPWRTQTRPSGS